ncbi:MAG TPA: CBS domain-containing protein [Stellaceae bacterium]|nr:CBS domain-containing protein [Stellaceae bacterium]
MIAADIMTKSVICTRPSAPVSEIAALLLKNKISAVPVVDDDGAVVGMVSEDDLLRHGTARKGQSWWLSLLAGDEMRPEELAKARDAIAADVMTRHVVATRENAPLKVVAGLLRRYRIKRIPVVRRKKLVGIISRADLVNALFDGTKRPPRSIKLPVQC